MHKPSPLWPPPSEEMNNEVHARLRMFARDAMHSHDGCEGTAASSSTFRMGTPTSDDGDRPSAPQFQFYAENRLLRHPLVSPALGYLGGLPPLFFIAGGGEVLRDEIVYTCVMSSYTSGSGIRLTITQFTGHIARRIPRSFLSVMM